MSSIIAKSLRRQSHLWHGSFTVARWRIEPLCSNVSDYRWHFRKSTEAVSRGGINALHLSLCARRLQHSFEPVRHQNGGRLHDSTSTVVIYAGITGRWIAASMGVADRCLFPDRKTTFAPEKFDTISKRRVDLCQRYRL